MKLARLRCLSLWFVWVPLFACTPLVRGGEASELARRIDALFARWDRADSPGCAVLVLHRGDVIHQRGYGSASLEQRIAITPETVFNIGSVSKQFTAFVIMLLAAAGLLDLDADVRTYVPELPDFGKSITARQLIHHTSGLREDWSLLNLGGWRNEDVITRGDVFDLIRRQKELNFAPGAEHLYCNTGYDVLALLVERVSGKSLRRYAEEAIFRPLGMNSTVFQDDFRMLIDRRAASYRPVAGKGFGHVLCATERAGPSNLYTTVLDLARWDRNLDDKAVGGSAVERLLHKGKLTGGKELSYAGGLRHASYRNQPVVEHAGVTAGYRAVLFRLPQQRFTVIILGNVSDLNTTGLARRVADAVLAGELPPQPARAPRTEIAVAPEVLDEYAGSYRFPTGIATVTRDSDRLVVRVPAAEEGRAVRAASTQEFFATEPDMSFRFSKDKQGALRLLWHTEGSASSGQRLTLLELTPAQLDAYVGAFRSDELDVTLQVVRRDSVLLLRQRQGELRMLPIAPDEFAAGADGTLTLRFARTADRITGFAASTPRARNVRFARINDD